jgi:prepilin-type N-terminal cleavage/methylation domain-containing protein
MNALRRFIHNAGFTLIELMVIVVIVGVIGAFAIPSYTKAVERAYEKDGVNNLILLSGAQEAYKARYGKYWPEFNGACGGGNCGIAGGLNTDLGLNIVQNDMNYMCSSRTLGIDYACYAVRNGGNNFMLYIDETMAPNPPTFPCCDKYSGITCPTATICP